MATNTSTGAGNYSDDTKWDLGHAPIATEDAVIAHAITWDAAQGLRIPATAGLLASLTGSGGGQLIVSMTTLADNASLNVTGAITPGTETLIALSGSAATKTLTINAGSIVGAPATSSKYGLSSNATCNLAVVGAVSGGGGSGAHGINVSANTKVSVTGNVTGGTGAQARGIEYDEAAAGYNLTIVGDVSGGPGAGNRTSGVFSYSVASALTGNMVITAYGMAWEGKPPVTWTPSPAGTTPITHGGAKYAVEPAAGDVAAGVQVGSVLGTFAGGGVRPIGAGGLCG